MDTKLVELTSDMIWWKVNIDLSEYGY